MVKITKEDKIMPLVTTKDMFEKSMKEHFAIRSI